jgi:hypothetical protein
VTGGQPPSTNAEPKPLGFSFAPPRLSAAHWCLPDAGGNHSQRGRFALMEAIQPIAMSCQHCQEPMRIVRTAAVGLLQKRLVFEWARCGTVS